MRSTLDELIAELAELKALVKSIDPVNSALADHKDNVVRQYVVIRRRFDYAAFAVALYASFEKFVENLITAYLRIEARRIPYAALPESLRKKHLCGTAELLSRGRLGEGRYLGMNDLSFVKNLFDCLSGANLYSLNEAALIAHEANLRAEQVDEVFRAVGMEDICERACQSDALRAWYCAAEGLEGPPQAGVKRGVIEERLKDIVERRNQVAHRGGNPVDLLGSAAMGEAIGFLESLATSIFGLVVGRYLEAHHTKSASSIALALRPEGGPFSKGTVVVVEKPDATLFVGQPIFVVVASTGARWGRIQSLELDDAEVKDIEATASAPNGVGIGLDFKFPRNPSAKLVALPCEDDLVWSPPTTAVPTAGIDAGQPRPM